jgi:hypothetical protein
VLKRQEVFEITDLSKGCKMIKNRWVFDIKTDGCKKACLVTKCFSQVERIDFFELLLSSGSRMEDSGLRRRIPKGLGLSLCAVPS